MAYNFKSIADVEVVEKPVDTANVLIEENGVVKKAPMSGVGGAFGFDVVVYHDDVATLSYGNYADLKAKIENKQAMLVAIVSCNSYYPSQYCMGLANYIDGKGEYIGIYNHDVSLEYQLYPDNTIRINDIG